MRLLKVCLSETCRHSCMYLEKLGDQIRPFLSYRWRSVELLFSRIGISTLVVECSRSRCLSFQHRQFGGQAALLGSGTGPRPPQFNDFVGTDKPGTLSVSAGISVSTGSLCRSCNHFTTKPARSPICWPLPHWASSESR